MYQGNNQINLRAILRRVPDAVAMISGGNAYPNIRGITKFYQTARGVLTVAEIDGLPSGNMRCDLRIFAFHIHDGQFCRGNITDDFRDVGSHYDPYRCPHPYHAGDMPPLFDAGGTAFSAFLTDRFTVQEIIGRTVIIHDSPDDFTTQPSGRSGVKIACGEIVPTRRRNNKHNS